MRERLVDLSFIHFQLLSLLFGLPAILIPAAFSLEVWRPLVLLSIAFNFPAGAIFNFRAAKATAKLMARFGTQVESNSFLKALHESLGTKTPYVTPAILLLLGLFLPIMGLVDPPVLLTWFMMPFFVSAILLVDWQHDEALLDLAKLNTV